MLILRLFYSLLNRLCYNFISKTKGLKMQKILELENDDFLYSLTASDKRVVKKAIDLYYDFLDYKDALRISKAIDNGTMKIISADEVFKRLDEKHAN